MRRILSSQILIFFLIFQYSQLFAENCTELNPNDYGDCSLPLGYIWYDDNCIYISGCSMLNDEEYFFNSYEECRLTCFNNSSLGDINDDAFINVIDVINLVNIILNNQEYLNSGDLNFDGYLDIIDVVSLVNIILVPNPETRDTWTIINNDILTPKCAQCHYPGSFYAETSNLILTSDIAYSQLINRQPTNNSALNDGLELLSDDGGMYGLLTSFFWEKININNENHFYSEHPYYGEIMPLGGPFLTNGELDFIEDWIWAGAPDTGIVADPLILNDISEYEAPEFSPLDIPETGVQYHIGPFDVYPNSEREFLYYVPPFEDEYYIKKVEMAMAPGSHHFISYIFSDNYFGNEPEPYTYRDIHSPYIDEFSNSGSPNPEWINNVMTLQEHTFVTGTQWPSWSYSMPEGVALKVDSDFGLDLNPHYFNYTDQTIQGEVYFNLHTIPEEEVEHIGGIMQLGDNEINLPPNQETVLTEIFSTQDIVNSINIEPPSNTSSLNIFQLFTHAHQLMTRFDVLLLHPNGEEELIYTALDYEHPPVLSFDPPLVLSAGQGLISRATYYNDTDNFVNFGLLSTDEMKIVFGLVYYD